MSTAEPTLRVVKHPPPNPAQQAERAVLGRMLIDPDFRAHAVADFEVSRFAEGLGRDLFRAMARLPGTCEGGSEIALLGAMKLDGWGIAEIADLIDAPGAETTAGALALAERLGSPVAPVALKASEITPREVRWLWGGRVPRGKATILAGPAGTGKTALALDLAARVTRGGAMPFDWADPVRGNIMIISTEDDADDTLVPRLAAARADLERCYVWPDDEALPALPDGEYALAAQLRCLDIRLLIVDPLSSLLGADLNSHRDADVRRLFSPLKRISKAADCSILGIAHLNKSINGTAISRIGGSVAWGAAARSVLLCVPDPEEQDEFIVAVAKVSNARRPPSIRMSRVTCEDGGLALKWLGESDESADELVAPKTGARGPQPEARSAAETWLTEWLADGPQWAADSYEAAEAEGISSTTLKRARMSLGVESSRNSEGRWSWSLAPRSPR